MLNYGANAQTYFGYNTENLANKSLSPTDQDASLEYCNFEPYKASETDDPSVTGITYYGSSLNLNTETNVKNYFEVEEGHSIEEFTFSYATNGRSDTVVEPVQQTINGKTLYLIEVPAIKRIF